MLTWFPNRVYLHPIDQLNHRDCLVAINAGHHYAHQQLFNYSGATISKIRCFFVAIFARWKPARSPNWPVLQWNQGNICFDSKLWDSKHSKLLGKPSCRAKLQKILISSAKRCLQLADELNELIKMLFGLLFRISEAFEYSFRIWSSDAYWLWMYSNHFGELAFQSTCSS